MQLAVSVDEQCKVPCRVPALTAAQAVAFRRHIRHGFNFTLCAVLRSSTFRSSAVCAARSTLLASVPCSVILNKQTLKHGAVTRPGTWTNTLWRSVPCCQSTAVISTTMTVCSPSVACWCGLHAAFDTLVSLPSASRRLGKLNLWAGLLKHARETGRKLSLFTFTLPSARRHTGLRRATQSRATQ